MNIKMIIMSTYDSCLKNAPYHKMPMFWFYKIIANYSPPAYLDLTRKNPSRKTCFRKTENKQSQT